VLFSIPAHETAQFKVAAKTDETLGSRTVRDIYTVSRLNREVRQLLEGSFPLLWVEGELSNLARPASGHWYFSLKDADAQVRCAMFRSRNARLAFAPEDGLQVLVRARVGLYENRGEFQLVAEHMEPAGDGALRLAFEQLKRKLDAEGLFDAAHKVALPAFPRCLGIVSSPTGAAVQDILAVLRRRYPALPVIIYPTAVQGASAPGEIVAAIKTAAARAECDLLILARGGGSLEDLWAFNDERLARTLFDCPIPIISGIGHEIDITIADFVADARAATPSASAELASPDREVLANRLAADARRLHYRTRAILDKSGQQVDWLHRRLVHPGRALREIGRLRENLLLRLELAARTQMKVQAGSLANLTVALAGASPLARIELHRQAAKQSAQRLNQAVNVRLSAYRARTGELVRALDAVSPLATLGRGYAIVSREVDGTIVRDAAQLRTGEQIRARVERGQILARVETLCEDPKGSE